MEKTIKKLEPYLFIILCIINCIPAFQDEVFATMDGGAHLYNSNLINQLLLGNSELIDSYFKFNYEPVPNYIGSIILSLFNLFLPVFYAEKILLLLCLIGLPMSFRYLIKTVSPNSLLISYFIFPFTYTSLFVLGFYNYSVGVVFLLITITYWLKNHTNIFSLKMFLRLFILCTIVYFSHIFIFAILLVFLFIHFISEFLLSIIDNGFKQKQAIIIHLKKAGLIIMACLPSLVFLLYYFISRSGTRVNVYLDNRTLIDQLKNLQTIIAYNPVVEEVFTKKIFYIIFIAFTISIYLVFSTFLEKYKQLNIKDIVKSICGSLWGVMTAAMAFLYFTIPDANGPGGFMVVRVALFLFLFLLIYISTLNLKKWFLYASVIGILFFTYKLHKYYHESISDLNQIVEKCYLASEHIDENSLVLPINYSENWLAGHFSNYLGAEKPMVILENYETDKGYFPLLWDYENMPNAKLKDIETSELFCLFWKNNSMNPTKIIDYVFVLGTIDSQSEGCGLEAKTHILKNYSLHYKNEECELYKLK